MKISKRNFNNSLLRRHFLLSTSLESRSIVGESKAKRLVLLTVKLVPAKLALTSLATTILATASTDWVRFATSYMSEKTVATNSRHRLSSPERRAAIVDAALHLFAEKGFRGTTTRELAARVGVSEPVLYEHFRTKRDLYAAIIDTKSHEQLEFTEALSPAAERGDDVAFFTQLGLSILGWHQSDPAFIRLLFFSGLEGHELKDIFFERKNDQFFTFVSRYIETRIAAGAFRPVNPMIATQGFLGMIAHHAVMRMFFNCVPGDAPNEVIVSNMVELFLHGVCRPGEAQK
jgi:AcrR family transcriptional regulator